MSTTDPAHELAISRLFEIINGAVLAAVAGHAMPPDAIRAAIGQALGLDPGAGASVAAQDAAATPISGRWRVESGVIVCGSVRMFSEDFDSYPSQPVNEDLLRWVCETLNTAQELGFSLAELQANADRYMALVNSGAYAPGKLPSCPWKRRTGKQSATKAELDAAADAAIASKRTAASKPAN